MSEASDLNARADRLEDELCGYPIGHQLMEFVQAAPSGRRTQAGADAPATHQEGQVTCDG